MVDLDFRVDSASVVPFAAAPEAAFHVAVTGPPDRFVHSVLLRCQIQIDATRRRYREDEQAKLVDLFGEPERWSRTLRPLLWTHVSHVIPPFMGEVALDLHVPCSFDFNVAATKYFHAMAGGDLPLRFLFSGTIFYEDDHGRLAVEPISWDREATYGWPVELWRQILETYCPNTVWLCLRRDVFVRLSDYRTREALPSWEAAVERLLAGAADPEPVIT